MLESQAAEQRQESEPEDEESEEFKESEECTGPSCLNTTRGRLLASGTLNEEMQKARSSLRQLTMQVTEESTSVHNNNLQSLDCTKEQNHEDDGKDKETCANADKAREQRRQMLETTFRGTPLPPVQGAALIRPSRGAPPHRRTSQRNLLASMSHSLVPPQSTNGLRDARSQPDSQSAHAADATMSPPSNSKSSGVCTAPAPPRTGVPRPGSRMGRPHAQAQQLQASTLRIVPPTGSTVSHLPGSNHPRGPAVDNACAMPARSPEDEDDDSLTSPNSSKDENSWSHSEEHLRDMQTVLMTLRAGIDILGRVSMPTLGGRVQ